MLHGTPIEERDPEATQPTSGFRSAYGTASGAGVLLTTTLYDDTGSLAFLPLDRSRELEPVEIAGLAHDGIGELEGLEQLVGDTYSLTYNIDGCSWVYAGAFDENARTFTVERVLVGEGELEGGVLHGIDHDEESGRFVASFCTATTPTQLHLCLRTPLRRRHSRASARSASRPRCSRSGRMRRSSLMTAFVSPPASTCRLLSSDSTGRARSSITSTVARRARSGPTSRGSRCR